MFIGYIEENQNMYDQLVKYGYQVVYRPTTTIGSKSGESTTKGNVDVELVLQVMKDYDNYDKAIIISGDGDFYSLIKYLVRRNKLKYLMVPNFKYSSLLKEFDYFVLDLNKFKFKKELSLYFRSKK